MRALERNENLCFFYVFSNVLLSKFSSRTTDKIINAVIRTSVALKKLLAETELLSSHSSQRLSVCTWSTVSSSDPHNSKKMRTDWRGSKGGPQ